MPSGVAEIISVANGPAAAEEQLRNLRQRARREHLKVAISGARHTMGGHTIYPEGIVLNMLPFNRMELDVDRRPLHVGSGARWSEAIPYRRDGGRASSTACPVPLPFPPVAEVRVHWAL